MGEDDLDRTIHQRTRLRILAYLYRNRQASFTTLRDELGVSGGNVTRHTETLEEAGYLERGEVLAGDGFEVRYRITAEGSEAFRDYVSQLEGLFEGTDLLDDG